MIIFSNWKCEKEERKTTSLFHLELTIAAKSPQYQKLVKQILKSETAYVALMAVT